MPPLSTKAVPVVPLSEPAAPAAPRFSVVPGLTVVAPVNVLAPVSDSVPAPFAVRPKPAPEITPPTVSVFASTVS